MNGVFASIVALTLITGFAGKAPKPTDIPDTFEQVEKMNRDSLSRMPDMRVQLGVPLSESTLQDYNKVALRLMRNSIYAQYGYPFTIKWIRDYFEAKKWYRSGNFDAVKVAAIDEANVRLIRQFENRINPVIPGDRIIHMDETGLSRLSNIQAALNKPIDESVLKTMSKRELKILRNSIFAQYGRDFKTPWIQKYFDSRPWYKRGNYTESMLTDIDRNNVALILRYENVGTTLAEKEILKIGYCERKSDMEIERYVFKAGNVLQYSVDSQSPYGRSSNETRKGRWRISAGGVEYQFAAEAEWEGLQIDRATHTCL